LLVRWRNAYEEREMRKTRIPAYKVRKFCDASHGESRLHGSETTKPVMPLPTRIRLNAAMRSMSTLAGLFMPYIMPISLKTFLERSLKYSLFD
jgi:hypothetical protein